MNDIKIDDRLCFVLMPFDEKFNPLYENILKNVIENEEFGLNCKRADEIFGTSAPESRICGNILKKQEF